MVRVGSFRPAFSHRNLLNSIVILITDQLENRPVNQVNGAGDGLVAAFSAHQDRGSWPSRRRP